VTLREAMAEAAERDRIARQYVTVYEEFSLSVCPRWRRPVAGMAARPGRRLPSI
jgi:hypothetical protein